MASPAQRPYPCLIYQGSKSVHCLSVARDSVIVEVSANHRLEPTALFQQRSMSAAHQQLTDFRYLRAQLLCNGFPTEGRTRDAGNLCNLHSFVERGTLVTYVTYTALEVSPSRKVTKLSSVPSVSLSLNRGPV
jgi:hypothetical protein